MALVNVFQRLFHTIAQHPCYVPLAPLEPRVLRGKIVANDVLHHWSTPPLVPIQTLLLLQHL